MHRNPLLDAEALAEHDSELCPGSGPLAWRHLPLATDLAQHCLEAVHPIWFQDEARIGQKNKITRRWAKRDTRPSAPHSCWMLAQRQGGRRRWML